MASLLKLKFMPWTTSKAGKQDNDTANAVRPPVSPSCRKRSWSPLSQTSHPGSQVPSSPGNFMFGLRPASTGSATPASTGSAMPRNPSPPSIRIGRAVTPEVVHEEAERCQQSIRQTAEARRLELQASVREWDELQKRIDDAARSEGLARERRAQELKAEHEEEEIRRQLAEVQQQKERKLAAKLAKEARTQQHLNDLMEKERKYLLRTIPPRGVCKRTIKVTNDKAKEAEKTQRESGDLQQLHMAAMAFMS